MGESGGSDEALARDLALLDECYDVASPSVRTLVKRYLEQEGVPHRFCMKNFSSPTYCNTCKQHMWGLGSHAGYRCEVCRYSVHIDCMKAMHPPMSCQPTSAALSDDFDARWRAMADASLGASSDVAMGLHTDELDGEAFFQHHWVEGNIPPGRLCFVCADPITLFGAEAHQCSRCLRSAHTICLLKHVIRDRLSRYSDVCQPLHSQLLLPLTRTPLSPYMLEYYTPLVVLVNSRSGGQQGKYLLRKFRRWLGPNQVLDLDASNPVTILQRFQHVPRIRVLACGGDGTVGWVLSSLDAIATPTKPPVAILPLGTGNDLARVLNWGGGYEDEALSSILEKVSLSQEQRLDRWKITILGRVEQSAEEIQQTEEVVEQEPLHGREYLTESAEVRVLETLYMNNYCSLGVDAGVALQFHGLRQDIPELCSSRLGNKLWYGLAGVRAMFDTLPFVDEYLRLEVDGENVALPKKIEGLIVLNVPSYAGGTDLWGTTTGTDAFKNPELDDELLEVVGIKGTLHMGVIRVSLSNAFRVAQGHRIRITFLSHEALPFQADGEPRMQEPCEIIIEHHGQATMLAAPGDIPDQSLSLQQDITETFV